jgi:two-component system, sensor histidine kinase
MPNNLPDDAKDLIHSMQLCSTFMSSIMNNLLDVRKMEEGKLEIRCEPFSLSKLVSNIYTMALPTGNPNVELLVETKTEGRDWVLGDIHRLEQIIYNLVSNSIKYTKNGSVTIYAGWEDDKVRLECRDTGPGIPKEEQDNMFERFTQRGGAPGSGLGLAIAKNLVNLMEGTIYFDSDPTKRPGTVCIVIIPLKSCDAPIETDDPSLEILPIDEPLRILIVDDVKMNRSMLRRRFEKCISPNCIIKEVSTGEESLTVCEQGEIFDVIVMDEYMHDAGGVMVGTDAIIALRRMKVKSFIIGCSGNDLDERFFTAGADLIWKKPMPSNSEIITQLRSAMGNKDREHPGTVCI